MPRSIEVDTSRLPFVVTVVRGAMLEPDVLAMQREFETLFRDRTRFVTITDARAMTGMPSAAVRRVITEWNVRFEAETAACNIAAASVFESALARAALRVIHWVAPHPVPYAVVSSVDEALAFVTRALVDAGVGIPEDIDARAIVVEGTQRSRV